MSAKKANVSLVLGKKKVKCRARKMMRSKETSEEKFKC